MIEARPDAIRVSPQDRSQNGIANVHEADDDEPAGVGADLDDGLAASISA